MRLIDADKLLEAGGAVKFSCERYESPNMAIVRQGAMFKKLVQEAPTVDAVPVVHGRWLPTNATDKKRCSRCDVIHMIAQYPLGVIDWCPNCGADMRGGNEDG